MNKGVVFDRDTERTAVQVVLTLLPPVYYFNKHRQVLLMSRLIKKQSSYYNPQANKLGHSDQNRFFHFKELAMRSVLGGMLGLGVSRYFYGAPEAKIDEEVAKTPGLAEALEDKDSLQYANYARKQQMKTEYDFMRPGKIKD